MTIDRRSIIQGIAAAPLAAQINAAAQKAAAQGYGGSVFGGKTASLGQYNSTPQPMSHPLVERYGQAAYDAMRAEREKMTQDQTYSDHLRIGGLDPDIMALRSASHAYRCVKQRDRWRARYSIFQEIQKALEW